MNKFPRGFKKRAEEQALEFRSMFGLHYTAPLEWQKLAEYLNVKVWLHNDVADLNSNDLTALCKEWSAATFTKQDGNPLIICNSSHSTERMNSDVMHEIAHILCKHPMSGIVAHPDLPSTIRRYDQQQEDEAEWLSGALLIPEKAILWAVRRNMPLEAIAEHFNVSSQMALYRKNITGAVRRVSRFRTATYLTQQVAN